MVGGLSQLVFMTLCSMILTTTSGIGFMKYRPYGPMMCLQVCRDSGGSSIALKGYHCRGISNKDQKSYKILSSEHSFHCFSIYKVSNYGTYLTSLPTKDTFDTSTKAAPTLLRTKDPADETGKSLTCSLDMNNNLNRACRAGNLTGVQRILSLGYDINCRDRSGRTPVMQAAVSGQVTVFNLLVSKGCDVMLVDKQNNTVIHQACMSGNIDIIKKILDRDKYQLEHRGKNGMTPVMIAACYCRKDVVDLLRKKHCNLSVVDRHKQTVLHLACRYGCTNVVDYVLSNYIQSIESRGRIGWTPLMIAAAFCKREVFDFLITKGGNVTAVDNHGYNILHLASQRNCTFVVDYILSKDLISRESRDRNGRTPLLLAAYTGHKEMVRFLLSKGCNLKAVDRSHENILHAACTTGHMNMLKYLLTLKEVDWQKKNSAGETPMQIAERRNRKAVVDLLKARFTNLK